MKVVINVCYGGFGLSEEAVGRLKELGCDKHKDDIDRSDPRLVQVVEELGELANGKHARLKIVKIPDDVKWWVEERDGWECVEEEHRTWG